MPTVSMLLLAEDASTSVTSHQAVESGRRRKRKKEKKIKKESKKHKSVDACFTSTRQANNTFDRVSTISEQEADVAMETKPGPGSPVERPLVESNAWTNNDEDVPLNHNVTLLLFYQYVEPPWSAAMYKEAQVFVKQLGNDSHLTGRMRVAREGLNCTLTGTADNIRNFCRSLRQWRPDCFNPTEFKLTHDLPQPQRFPTLKIIPVTELVNYGLEDLKAPPLRQYHGVHLEPQDYHQKLSEPDTVVIDVRNHYEAAIGHFDTPNFLDPKMRKSTEFPLWLDNPQTHEQLQNKQVLMYCTGGIRCERASALLKYRMEHDPRVQQLGIKGVYQLQGGVDKYFKEFPDGGMWKGKNYTFDKRCAHAPQELKQDEQCIGQCEACRKPWDQYRGKRRCPTCGVPSLICRDCWHADQNGARKLNQTIRCDLCREQNVRSKHELRARAENDLRDYEVRLKARGVDKLCGLTDPDPNPDNVTRLWLKNMCKHKMTDEVLLDFLPGITHIVWRNDKMGNFTGQGWVEMDSPKAATMAVQKSGHIVLGRPLFFILQPPDGKDAWPPPSSRVR